MKNRVFIIISLCFSFALGMFFYRNNWFPRPQIKQLKNIISPEIEVPESNIDKQIIFYTAGVPVFSDRKYYDIEKDPRLDSLYLIQIPRHTHEEITLKLHFKANVFRFLTDSNDISDFDNWTLSDIKINIQGNLSKHSIVVFKQFEPGIINLESGGPLSSSPILIKYLPSEMIQLPVNILN